jgi:hypothetical protein
VKVHRDESGKMTHVFESTRFKETLKEHGINEIADLNHKKSHKKSTNKNLHALVGLGAQLQVGEHVGHHRDRLRTADTDDEEWIFTCVFEKAKNKIKISDTRSNYSVMW